MAELIRQGLEEEAYAVDVVNDGRQALEWLRLIDYDLAILDLMLPGMDGLQVCREYRANGGRLPPMLRPDSDTMAEFHYFADKGGGELLGKPLLELPGTAPLLSLATPGGPTEK